MHPPAEDNYGNDACSILCLPSMFDLYTDISDQLNLVSKDPC